MRCPVIRLIRLLAALSLLIPVTAVAISDIGRPELTRLWVSTSAENQFVCTASYIFPFIGEGRSLILSAGHCAEADLVARNQSKTAWGIISWLATFQTHGANGITSDIAIGRVPDLRDDVHKLWLADHFPNNEQVFVHSFPHGIEVVTEGVSAPADMAKQVSFLRTIETPFGLATERVTLADAFPGTRFIVTPPGRVGPGSSGAPVLGPNDRVVAIVWGGASAASMIQGLPEAFAGWDLVFVTPIESVHETLKILGYEKTGG